MTPLKQQISTDTIFNKKVIILNQSINQSINYYCSNQHFDDFLLNIITFFYWKWYQWHLLF